MQLATSGNFGAVSRIRFFHLQPNIDFQFFFQPLTDVAGSDIFAGLSCKRRGVDHEVHRQRRLFNPDHRQRTDIFRITQRIPDGNIRNTGNHDNFSALRFRYRNPAQALIDEYLIDFTAFLPAFIIAQNHGAAFF